MGLYNFQEQFVSYVLDGSKTHTIRASRKYPDKPGNMLHLYTGLRQKSARLLFRVPCVRVEDIRIHCAQMWINGEELSLSEKNQLAWRDGFRVRPQTGCFDRMLQFWIEKHGSTEFTGHIIHWDHSRRIGGVQ